MYIVVFNILQTIYSTEGYVLKYTALPSNVHHITQIYYYIITEKSGDPQRHRMEMTRTVLSNNI